MEIWYKSACTPNDSPEQHRKIKYECQHQLRAVEAVRPKEHQGLYREGEGLPEMAKRALQAIGTTLEE